MDESRSVGRRNAHGDGDGLVGTWFVVVLMMH